MNVWQKVVGEEWYEVLYPIFTTNYSNDLLTNLMREYKSKTVYPDKNNIFRVFKLIKPSDVQVVCLGMSPYYDGSATGIPFGNDPNIANMKEPNPSLLQIEKAVEKDIYNGLNITFDLTLESWLKQGVLLLNSSLTVVKGNPHSHLKMWRPFIAGVITCINRYTNDNNRNMIYMLWGTAARSFSRYINPKLYLLTEVHPSYTARNNKDWECNHFSEVNSLLETWGKTKIKW